MNSRTWQGMGPQAIKLCCLVACMLMTGVQPRAEVDGREDLSTKHSFVLRQDGHLTASEIGDGVWWSPEASETSITQVMDDLSSWGIANVYVDVFRNGHALHVSKEFPRRNGFEGNDWLRDIIEEGHRRKIRVHGWVQVLKWRDETSEDESTHPLLLEHADWMEIAADGSQMDGKTSAVYVCPGVPAVREKLEALVGELCQYPLDGICLDSLEYSPRVETGYNAAMRQEFRRLHEADPAVLRRDPDEDSPWMKWVAFREDNLTSLVQILADRVREASQVSERRIMVSATVQPGYEDNRGLNPRYQNWRKWLDAKLVDATMPQCFNPQLPDLEQELWEARSIHTGSHVACIPGLALTMENGETHPTLAEQRRLLRNAGFQHCTVLDYLALRRAQAEPEKEPARDGGFWGFLKKR